MSANKCKYAQGGPEPYISLDKKERASFKTFESEYSLFDFGNSYYII